MSTTTEIPAREINVVSSVLQADCPVQTVGNQLLADRKVGFDAAPPVIGSRMRVFKQDPSVQDLNVRTVYLPGELKAGPRDDAIRIAGLAPLLPDVNGDFVFHPATAPAEFDAAHTFAIVRQTLNMFERQLGESIPWQWNRNGGSTPIAVFPHGGEGANAFYSRDDRGLRFFHFTPTGRTNKVFTCRSLDIVGHETGHAILDALRPDWWVWPAPPQLGGLHESFGDLTTILLILSQFDLAEFVVAETKADLHQKSVLSALAEEFGASLHRLNGLRNADNDLKLSDVTNEVHDISQVFTGAVFDVLADLYSIRRVPRRKDDAEVLHETAMYLGGLLLKAIREADTTQEDLQFNAYRVVANQLCDVAKARNDGALCDLITHHFTRREIAGAGAYDAPRVAARAGGACGTIRILGRGSQY